MAHLCAVATLKSPVTGTFAALHVSTLYLSILRRWVLDVPLP